jgi:integrase
MPRVEKPTQAAGVSRPAIPEPEQLNLFGPVMDLEVLRMERAAISERKRSANTRRAYAFDWIDFERWCVEAQRRPLPALPDTVSLYAVHLARAGRLPSTIQRRAAAIAARHLAAGSASPVTPDVREVLAGVGRKLGTAPVHAKAALSVEELRKLLASCPDDGRGARDRAVLVLGFASALRRSELVSIDLASVDFVRQGLCLRLGRSKTDQDGAGAELGISRGRHRVTCPVRVLEGWLRERGRWPGPLFCRLSPGGAILRERMSDATVAAVVKAAAARAGLDPSKYGGHSLRAGLATAAAGAGADTLAIMRRTRHKTLAMVERYVRHGSLFSADPMAGVL